MSNVQKIENALKEINEAVFQELCDAIIIRKYNNYSLFSRVGSQSGKQKTIKGTPDTLIRLPSGKYILVEYSTNISNKTSKIISDIRKCIDINANKGITIDQIEEIIVCINFNLSTSEIDKLLSEVSNYEIKLTIYQLDSLACELKLNHRDLARDYLNIPIDTGQIVTINTFINEYNKASRGIATPLDNPFLFREKEIEDINLALKVSDFIIIRGLAGVGKTRLAIESINLFLKSNVNYQCFCVSNKQCQLLDDLYSNIDNNKNLILFVDDANRIDTFGQILGYYKQYKANIKLIITVRDYAYLEIYNQIQVLCPHTIIINKFNDEQICQIISNDPYNIKNGEFQNNINRISEGNPRLAIMLSLLAIKTNNIECLHNVSELFECYFSTFVNDNGEFSKSINIKCLGLIACFYTLPYKDKTVIKGILDVYNINYEDFIDSIDVLEKLELVNIQFDYVKIPEQNLATFFFYKAFFKESQLSLQILVDNFFEKNIYQFEDIIISTERMFGNELFEHTLKSVLENYFSKLTDDKIKCELFTKFGVYLQDELLLFIYNKVSSLPIIQEQNYIIEKKNYNYILHKDNYIDLLSNLFSIQNNYKQAIELSFEYVRKCPNYISELAYYINYYFSFNDNSLNIDRQTFILEMLLKGMEEDDKLSFTLFYNVSLTFLKQSFFRLENEDIKSISNNILSYDIKSIINLRNKIWITIKKYFLVIPNDSFTLLSSYSDLDFLKSDLPYLIAIIDSKLDPLSILHCKYVNKIIRKYHKNYILDNKFEKLKQKFTNRTYEIYLIISWEYQLNKYTYGFDNYRDFKILKEKDIRSKFVFKTIKEIEEFYNAYKLIHTNIKEEEFYRSLDIIIDENFKQSIEIGYQILSVIIDNQNITNYCLCNNFYLNYLAENNIILFEKLFTSRIYNNRYYWVINLYLFYPEKLITAKISNEFLNFLNSLEYYYIDSFDPYLKYNAIDNNFLHKLITQIIYTNKTGSKKIKLSSHIFELGLNYFDNIDIAKEAYLQQIEFDSNYFDFDFKGLLNILKHDKFFLIDFVKLLWKTKNENSLHYEEKYFGIVWSIDDIEEVIKQIFDIAPKNAHSFGFRSHFCKIFFNGVDNKFKDRSNLFLFEYAKENNNDVNKMNVVVGVTRSMSYIFKVILQEHIKINTDINVFKHINWIAKGGIYNGNVIVGDINAVEWKEILSIIEEVDKSMKTQSIRYYIKEQIKNTLDQANWERKIRFLSKR